MRISLSTLFRTSLFITLFIVVQTACSIFAGKNIETISTHAFSSSENFTKTIPQEDSIRIAVGTFLGNESRNYYGDSVGDKLNVIWKTFLGKGTTIVTAEKGVEEWFGAGWTGQPLVVKENEKTFLIQGAFDHHLKKIDAQTGEVIWNYEYDDILKGTGTIWKNDSAKNPLDRIVIMQGSRKGVQNSIGAAHVSSFRAVSFFTGKELWRMNVAQTECYSRDVDASALVRHDTAYIGLENGTFVQFDPGKNVVKEDTVNRPVIFSETMLYSETDHTHHGGNLVTESSPARIGDHIYITAGSGHVYGFNMHTRKMDWDFYIGSDMDGSPVVTADSCLLVEVEKQYISGKGGVFKLNPRRAPESAVDWYFPTNDFHFSDWEGGVIGSVAVNDVYNDGTFPHLAAFTGIDGDLNVVCYDQINSDSTKVGPDGKTNYPTPVLKYRHHIGPSISTPIFTQNKLVAAGYHGINLFEFDQQGNFSLKDNWQGNFEASPVADEGRIYIASRDGFLYCFGDTSKKICENLRQSAAVQPAKKVLPKKAIAHSPKAKNAFPFRLVFHPRAKPKQEVVAQVDSKTKPQAEIPVVKQTPIAAVVPPKPKPTVTPEISAPSGNVDASFHLIAGVFKSKENAERNLKLWKGRGLPAVLFVTPSGMNYISIAQGASAEELSAQMQKVKTDFGVDAWVFQKK